MTSNRRLVSNYYGATLSCRLRSRVLKQSALFFTILLACSSAALSQGSSLTAATAIPDGDFNAQVKDMGLVESTIPIREMVKGWHKPKKIIVFVDDRPGRLAWLQEVAPGVKLVSVHTNAEAMAQIVDADAQLGGSCSKELIMAGKNLEWVHDAHAGVERCFGGEIPEKITDGTVVVTNLQRVLSRTIADHTMALIFALTRGLDQYIRMDEEGHDSRTEAEDVIAHQSDVQGKTIFIAGLGGIGTEVAKIAHALDMKVIGTRNTDRSRPDFVDYVGLADETPTLVGQADFVVCALPLTPETTGLFNADMFARMKKGAIFINVARGKEAVSADLLAALKSGQLGGAGLDATDPEPLPNNDPLFTAPHVIVTPHIAAYTADPELNANGETTWRVARENLKRFVAGDKLYSVVDPKRGY